MHGGHAAWVTRQPNCMHTLLPGTLTVLARDVRRFQVLNQRYDIVFYYFKNVTTVPGSAGQVGWYAARPAAAEQACMACNRIECGNTRGLSGSRARHTQPREMC